MHGFTERNIFLQAPRKKMERKIFHHLSFSTCSTFCAAPRYASGEYVSNVEQIQRPPEAQNALPN